MCAWNALESGELMTVIDKRKKQSRTRTWFQAAWFAVTNGYLRGYTSGKIFVGNTKAVCVPGLNCYSCPGALGSCPIGSLQAVLDSRNYKISLYVFGLLTAFGVLFGRLVCGWMCPFGLVQDLLYKIKTKFKKKNLPGHQYLRYLRFVVLIVFVILLPACLTDASGTGKPTFCEFICPSGMLLGGIPLTIVNEGFRAAVGIRFWWKFAILVVIAIGSIFWFRPFCKYLCPLGAIYGLFNPISTYRLEIDHDKCIRCGACQKACGMDIRTFETPNSMDCIRCGACIAACPKEAISSTWGKTRASVINRCFIDDTNMVSNSEAAVTPRFVETSAIFLGISLIMSSIVGVFFSIVELYTTITYPVIHQIYSMPMYGIPYIVLSLAAFIMMFLTGIYVIRYRKDSDRLLSVKEKGRLIVIVYLISYAALGIAVAFSRYVLAGVIAYLIGFAYFFAGVLLVWPLTSQFVRMIEKPESKPTLFIVLLVLFYALIIMPFFRVIRFMFRLIVQ